MKICWFSILLAVQCGWTQVTPVASEKPAGLRNDTVIAQINGRDFTVRDYEQLLAAMTPQARQAASMQPRTVLEQYALFQNILTEAEQSKLDQQSPHKERIEEARRQILVQAQIGKRSAQVQVSPEDQKKFYESNKSRYTEAKAKVIFISSVSQTQTLDGKPQQLREPPASKKLAEDVVARLKAGADFVKLAKEHSDDGATADTGADYPDVIRSSSSSIPQDIRTAVLAAKPGDIVGPLEHPTGFYIFRIESVNLVPFETVRGDIQNELREAGVQKWLEETKSRSSVKIQNEAFFSEPPISVQK